ncbi:HD domain-containing protein [Tsukamurella serpentis]
MTEVGTLEWVAETGGRLSPAQALRFAAVEIVGQARLLADLRRPAPTSPAVVEPPHTTGEAAVEVTRYAQERLPEPLLNHSLRVWVLAYALVPDAPDTMDHDLLLAACLLHDAGLADRDRDRDRGCFTVRSAEIASGILERVGFDAKATGEVAAAIVGHMNAAPPADASPLTVALHTATHLDVTGAQAHRLPRAVLSATNARYPRAGFAGCFSGDFRREFFRAPLTRAGVAWAIGLPIAVRLNPLARA